MPCRRLLILDDELAVAQTIGFIAEAAGVEARATVQAHEFFRELAQWQPTHVALDLMMPGMDGVEVMRQLADYGCRARIIISSGVGLRVLDAARRSAAEHGLNIAGVLSKPFAAAALRALLADTGAASAAPADVPLVAAFEVTEAALRRALEQREFRVEYQPKIECATGAVAGFEALVRWHHPDAGLLLPDRFIPQAESSGLIGELTGQLIDQSLKWLAQGAAPSHACLSLNLSARSLGELQLADRIFDCCRQWAIDPQRLILEVTESSAMEDPTTALDLLTRFRMKGFQLSLDDFGTGYSSMVQLVRLPFSEMKVDKSFVMTASLSQESRTIIKSIVELGHGLGLKVAAEGVEDQQTLDYLNSLGCDLAQGYLIACALPGDEVAAWVAQWQGST